MAKFYRVKSVKQDAYIGLFSPGEGETTADDTWDYREEVIYEEITKEEFDDLWDAPII